MTSLLSLGIGRDLFEHIVRVIALLAGVWIGMLWRKDLHAEAQQKAEFWMGEALKAQADAKLCEGTHALAVQQLRTERERRFSVQSDVQFEDTSRGLPS